jgi:hypothetical protein
MRFMQGVFLLCLCLLIVFGACRRNQPSLVDTNQPPDTQLWYAPPDSSEYEYLVHMYWRGEDPDGTAMEFIWTIQDSLVEGELGWDPSSRLRDFRTGRMTSKTDSIFSFTAFRNVGGVGVRKNRQAFYIASIDDNGVIDPVPAAMEFIATIAKLPRMLFATNIGGDSRAYVQQSLNDTIGVFEPFQITYHGITTNTDDPLLRPREYKFFPLTGGVFLTGQDEWTDDLTDTTRFFSNTGDDEIPSGIFRFAAQCKDDAQAESPIDAGTFVRGVCQVVVNWDPETRIHDVKSSYTVDDVVYTEDVLFDDPDGVPDTVSYDSWLWINYTGTDSDKDAHKCAPTDLNKCIGFQVAYFRDSDRIDGAKEFSLWQPRIGDHDTDEFSATDSNTFHIGSLEYDLFARAIDENGRPDGTPPSVHIIGNFDPVVDEVAVEDHLGNRIDLSVVDTLNFNFWKGEGYPYQCECDTVAKPQIFCDFDIKCGGRQFPKSNGSFDFYKTWSVHITALAHDHPKDPTGSGAKAWMYVVKDSQGKFMNIGKGLAGWFDGMEVNVLDDRIAWTAYYPSYLTAGPPGDVYGDAVYANLPSWFDMDMTFMLIGRDTYKLENEFEQSIFINGEQAIINVFPAATLGRWTQESVFTFQVHLMPSR